MSTLRLAGFSSLLIATALVGGTIIGSVEAATTATGAPPIVVAAAPSLGAPSSTRSGAFCAAFRRAFATNLGVDDPGLVAAAKAAAISAVDAAVAAGQMTRTRADRLKTRIGKADGARCGLLAGRFGAAGGGGAAHAGAVVNDALAAAAHALGISPAELGADLRSGKTLRDLAATRNVPYETVSGAVVAAVKAKLDARVAAGDLKPQRADRILQRLERNLADGRLRAVRRPSPAGPLGSPAPSPGS